MTSASSKSGLSTLPWRRTAQIAGVFCLLLGLVMLASHLRVRGQDPWKSPRLNALKEQLRVEPKNEPVKQQIRSLDLSLRSRYFNYLSRMETGVYLLIGGAALLIMSATRAQSCGLPLPDFSRKPDAGEHSRVRAASRWSVAAAGVALLIAFVVMGLGSPSPLPKSPAEVEKLLGSATPASSEIAPDAATLEEYRKNWPRFLGPDANGFAAMAVDPPLTWDAASGKGILWKAPAELEGFNSPLTWGDRLFYSGGNSAKREVICTDIKSGKILWREALKDVPGSPAQLPEIPESTGLAASTMATDGRRVYVIFANGDLGAFALDGKQVWAKYVGPMKNAYGYANSLATWQDRVIVQLDQGSSEEGLSKVVVLDGKTGSVVWQKQRKTGASWASPVVYEAAGKAQIALLSLPWVIAYSAKDGAELWRADCLNGEVTPSAIFAGGFLIVPSPSEKITAFKPDGSGDVAKTHAAWVYEEAVPDVSTPAANRDLLFMMTTSGLLTAVDLKNGKRVWEKDFETEFHASPAIAGTNLYLISQKGTAIVAEAGPQYKELFRTDIPDAFHASPAFTANKMILRGITNIWCIGK